MNNKVALEWAYEPITYVEEPYEIQSFDYVIKQEIEVRFDYIIYIGNGIAKITLESQDEYYGEMIDKIQSVLENSFLSMSVVTGESWKLGTLSELFPDGSRVSLMSACIDVDQSKVIITDYIKQKKGIPYLDTRTETLEEKKKRKIEENPELYAKKCLSRELHDKHKDNSTLKIIMGRYLAARQARDDKEKTRLLYDVRDALQEHFKQEQFKKYGGAKGMLKKSNPSEKDTIETFWDDWGLIANSRIDTRHTGGARVRLELSLKDEKEDTREKERLLEVNSRPVTDVANASDKYAKKFIELYLNYLEYLEKNPQ